MSVVAAGTLAIGAYAAYSTSKNQKDAIKQQQAGIAASDPYAPYRDQAAQQLNALVADPSSITGTADYKARQQAAARTIAAQGYTGSGNAIDAAANAGGQAYQAAFNNLSTLAGAGTSPGAGYASADAAQNVTNAQGTNNLSGIGNSLVYGAGKLYDSWNGGGNLQPIDVGSVSPSTYSNADITW